MRTTSSPSPRWPLRGGGLGLAALAFVAVDYLRHLSPTWHALLRPVLWIVLALVVVIRALSYGHWREEFRDTQPLPDTGQWLLLALNEKLPETMVQILRAHIVGLEHFLMLFVMLAFSVLFGSVRFPGFRLGARYMFTMGIGRLLRAITFVSTILPSPRPWCAASRFHVPAHPHRWAQKYYVPYASDYNAIRQVIHQDIAYADVWVYKKEYHPNWGTMSFLADFLRPFPYEGAWYNLLKRAGGGCNDLLYSGHILVAVLTAMAWTEAYGGYSSAFIWMLVLHSAQREIRERHHYSADCIVAIYVGILLWKMTGFLWSTEDASRARRLNMLEKNLGRLTQALKDSDIVRARDLVEQVELSCEESQNSISKAMKFVAVGTIVCTLTVVFLAFALTNDG